MITHNIIFNEHRVLQNLGHYLPAQKPLKDFVHHNTLHAFQHRKFFDALQQANAIFGYKVLLDLEEYRSFYWAGRISRKILDQQIIEKYGKSAIPEWNFKLLNQKYDADFLPRIGLLRRQWKQEYHIDLDLLIQPILFRTLCSYLDQGISIWKFPVSDLGLLNSVRVLEKNSFVSLFKTERPKQLLMNEDCSIADLLKLLVGDETLYEHYLFDQQFSHPGWSGMVATLEKEPSGLLDRKKISLYDLIFLELLLEIDALDNKFGKIWTAIASNMDKKPIPLFAQTDQSELMEVLQLWQEAFEWTYYDQVLAGLQHENIPEPTIGDKSFQAFFCIDDRECSLRRYIEADDVHCETFGTPGFFGVEFFYQPEDGKFFTKLCPAPITPAYLIKEGGSTLIRQTEPHFGKHSHFLVSGIFISQVLGFWAAARLFLNIFRPSASPATASSFKHMDKFSTLKIENTDISDVQDGLQLGFTVVEMADRVEALLRSTGLTKNFASLVYLIGHGSSSVNNPHYAAYDCGACFGRPGSVNARVCSFMANHSSVRNLLAERGIEIPEFTQFLGGLHDTTRDEMVFYDEGNLTADNSIAHLKNLKTFAKALDQNAKERSRRFEAINSHQSAQKIHQAILRRSVSLFEPRPELNHATNALCIIGRRNLSKGLFLDRRSFLNSYDYESDPDGMLLKNVVKPIGPVCGGINLEYFFSRVDNQKLGAGTKLPHNVMGLFGVANGTDGDLRTGLPSQMIEVHDPIRLLLMVEHFPEVVLRAIRHDAQVFEVFENEWIRLVAVNPETRETFLFKKDNFIPYFPINSAVENLRDLEQRIENETENLPVYNL